MPPESDPEDDPLIPDDGETCGDIMLKEMEQSLVEAQKVKMEQHTISLTSPSIASPSDPVMIPTSVPPPVVTSMPPVIPAMSPLSSKSIKSSKSGSSKGGSSRGTPVKVGRRRGRRKTMNPQWARTP